MASENIFVTIKQGVLRGLKEETAYGDIYYSFQGIPYGKAPVGELRFKAPQPADDWAGIRDATKPGASSPALDVTSVEGLKSLSDSNEDCLFLNVFAKNLPQAGGKYPVLVYIHGGGYTFGNGNKNTATPDYFMAHDIILVTINYRLGALGFLSLQTPECPGNYGLKDQRLALRWVQNNISDFGGDPDNVTIFGISAGGSSIHNLTISPSCKGLFKRAIAQSGSSTSAWGYSLHPRESAYLLGKRLGCDAKNDEELLNFLKKSSAEEIVCKSVGIWIEIEGERIGEKILNFPFCPTREPESEEAILPNEPMTKGNQLDIPYITGVTDKEMIMEIYNPSTVPKWMEDKDFQQLIPRELNVEKDSKLSLQIARKIREFFFKDKEVDRDGLIDALSDIHFVHGVHRAIKHRITNDNIKSPTYAYVFSYKGKVSFIKMAFEKFFKLEGFSDTSGVSHGDDTPYLFGLEVPKFVQEPGTPDYEVMKKFVQMWVNFATTGEPIDEKSDVKWQPIDTKNDAYLDINEKLELKKGFFKERMEFWDEIYRLAGKEPYSNDE